MRTKELYREFIARLQRQWAIETGVIEDVYKVSPGTTIALIEKGLDASLISHEDTNESAENVILKIKDNQHAIQGLYSFVSGQRPLGTSYIKELHAVITAHQDTYIARDTLGNLVHRELPKGEWKRYSNSVEHVDGSVFEYCPPEHVAAEIDRLLLLHHNHTKDKVSPEIESAWLHHRFSLIHPFTDGNGRVSRCLATLVLLKAEWLPLVITRNERVEYISALRRADAGDLKALIELFSRLQRLALRQALSLGESVIHEFTTVSDILSNVKNKLQNRRKETSNSPKVLRKIADSLLLLTTERLEGTAKEISTLVKAEEGLDFASMRKGEMGAQNSKWYYHQIISCLKKLGYFADFQSYQAWAALHIRIGQQVEVLFSFHGVGRLNSGVIGCAPMMYTREKTEFGDTILGEVEPLSDSPFEFSYKENSSDVIKRYTLWYDECMLKALTRWQEVV